VGSSYRVSTQAALWHRKSLLALLEPNESAWQFETAATNRSDRLYAVGFFGVFDSAFPYRHHVVEKGKWFPWEARRFDRMNIGCDFSSRDIMTIQESASWLCQKSFSLFLASLPGSLRQSVLKIGRTTKRFF
jgi:hypothetical protein